MTTYPSFSKQKLETETFSLAKQVLEEVISIGVEEFCLCPGARNAPFVYPLAHASHIRLYNWPEERSAAFFALGRIKATGRPVAVVTTSGTAVAELLPAVMEAYYTGLPLVVITADRPRRFRGTGAPQSVEQAGIFGCYTSYSQDLVENDFCDLNPWNQQGPVHLNVCFEEPKDQDCQLTRLDPGPVIKTFIPSLLPFFNEKYVHFLQQTRFPLVVVGALSPQLYEEAIQFLLYLKAPVYVEAISGIREDARLHHLRVTRLERVWDFAAQYDYPIDGILRLGSIPTIRLWRDLEDKSDQIAVYSISEQPFSGLSCADVIYTSLSSFFREAQTIPLPYSYSFSKWLEADQIAQQALQQLFREEPLAEPSLIHALSKKIPKNSKIYLGNSLPIREWDQAATYQSNHFQIACSRGANGIDGQMATFLGYSSSEQENWSILGDLTVLYDLVAPWITAQLPALKTTVVIINNGGGKIFSRMFAHPAFQNTHCLDFEPLAKFWDWQYEKWREIPSQISSSLGGRFIELIPDNQATERFLKRLKEI